MTGLWMILSVLTAVAAPWGSDEAAHYTFIQDY